MLQDMWQEAPVRLRAAPETLQLPLLPARRLRVARRMVLGVIALYIVELWLRGHLVVASLVLLIAVVGSWPARRNQPRALRIDPDGSLHLQWHSGTWESQQLGAASLLSGAHVLLVLRGKGRVWRLLLGPDNLAGHQLAALRRRLRAGPARGGSALHSVAAPGSHSSSNSLETLHLKALNSTKGRTFRPSRGPC